ncbi:hypothetical protein B0T25DRAFT_336859 [Lasiosphaeria hispida]|uniref:RING-type domain-containing protein n=1 Tax=Lasiosphaeria hispida TaxID=260671 RepID=A0AAJ0H6H0_9PEZI|nr:hypothetical protein B0T25DRAFT_336859 [Lasiosphaeria hispida]
MSVAVDEIRNVVLLFSNPSWVGVGTVPSTIIRNITALSSQIAYSARISQNITVLASKGAGTSSGLLYVPDLPPDDPCVNQTASAVPESAVRRGDLPPTNYNLIALAPWISSTCSRKYLASARTDPLRGFIFYRPGNSSAEPPSANSPVWDLNGGSRWKTQSSYPVYAVSGLVGHEMMRQLSLYSGNLTEVPFGRNITDLYDPDPDDYVRVWTELTISGPSSAFGIWVYFLIIAAVLLAVVSATSLLMHFIQARRRAWLRHRVIAGEVNLEGMGIKRLTVPVDHIHTFPLYTYHLKPGATSPPASPRSPTSPRRSRANRRSHDLSGDSITPIPSEHAAMSSEKGHHGLLAISSIASDYQPLCAICLEPYKNRSTVIRELPCGHIFHPDCIDEFLGENSSLCPLCKVSMLPKGHCPKITNAMVRRERAIRRLRDQVVVEEDAPEESTPGERIHSFGSSIRRHVFNSVDATPVSPDLTGLQPPQPTPASQQPQQPSQRQAEKRPATVTRERMRELAGSELDDDAESQLTKWQKFKVKVFPGF